MRNLKKFFKITGIIFSVLMLLCVPVKNVEAVSCSVKAAGLLKIWNSNYLMHPGGDMKQDKGPGAGGPENNKAPDQGRGPEQNKGHEQEKKPAQEKNPDHGGPGEGQKKAEPKRQENAPQNDVVNNNQPDYGVNNSNQNNQQNAEPVQEQIPEETAEVTTPEETTETPETTVCTSASTVKSTTSGKTTTAAVTSEGPDKSETSTSTAVTSESVSKISSGFMKAVTILTLIVFVILSGVFVVWLQKMI